MISQTSKLSSSLFRGLQICGFFFLEKTSSPTRLSASITTVKNRCRDYTIGGLFSQVLLNLLLLVSVPGILLSASCSKAPQDAKTIPPDSICIENLPDAGQTLVERLNILKEGDIFKAYPDLRYKYSSDIEKEVFLKSEEPKQLQEKIKTDLEKILHSTFKMDLGNISLSDYDVKEDAFEIKAGSMYMKCMEGKLSDIYTIDEFDFENLPFKYELKQPSLWNILDSDHSRRLLLRMAREDALKLGRDKSSDIRAYVIFNLKAISGDKLETKDNAIALFDTFTRKTLYIVKFGNFNEHGVWKGKGNRKEDLFRD